MTNVSLVDPRYVDGEPWEVAGIAGNQTLDALDLANEALEGLYWSARGSWMSQEHHRTGKMPERGQFEQKPLGRQIEAAAEKLKDLQKQVKTITIAASFDPRSV